MFLKVIENKRYLHVTKAGVLIHIVLAYTVRIVPSQEGTNLTVYARAMCRDTPALMTCAYLLIFMTFSRQLDMPLGRNVPPN